MALRSQTLADPSTWARLLHIPPGLPVLAVILACLSVGLGAPCLAKARQGDPRLVWKAELLLPDSVRDLELGPSTAGVVPVRFNSFSGSNTAEATRTGTLTAFAAGTGARLWTVSSPPILGMTADSGCLYLLERLEP